MMHARVKGIYEAAAMDLEKLPAPKEFWFDDKLLDEWYEARRAINREPDA